MIHSFLLIGQSNMAGRGFLQEVAPIQNDRLFVLRNGRWQKLFTPIHFDRPFAGVSLAESFADAYSQEHDVEVGLIPCADGGTNLDQWQVGSLLYDHAVYQVKLAERISTLAGVLWHQGESDCAEERYPFYTEKFLRILHGFQRDLPIYDVPFLLGGLGDFLQDCKVDPHVKNYDFVNKQLRKIAEETPMVGFVSAEGLSCNPDHLHFSAEALRAFGLRYYAVFRTLEEKKKQFLQKPEEDAALRNPLELL